MLGRGCGILSSRVEGERGGGEEGRDRTNDEKEGHRAPEGYVEC